VAFVITQADTGKTFTLSAGSAAELRLGGTFRWSPPKATPPIVVLTPEAVSSDGSQTWRITPTGRGSTVVESTGGPPCQPGQLCAQFVVLFRVTIVVGSQGP
jgi:hypothetical protein